ncbi:MAG: FAD-binding oxidoreductase [Chitinophagaceae bacterium]|nr:FAD-binding oxidoreductase [Chitinophagaceae bacterium]
MSQLHQHIQSEVTIIGGGIVGCCTALELRKRNFIVTIVEKGYLNGGASCNNAGGLYFQLQNQAGNFNESQQRELKKSLGLILNSRKSWVELNEYLNNKDGFNLNGGFIVAFNDEQAASLKKKHKLEMEWGINTELVTREEILKLMPYVSPHITGGSYHSGEGFADPEIIGKKLKEKLL